MSAVTFRQRAILGAVGAVSGLIGGVGLSLVVTQAGVSVDWVPRFGLGGVVTGFLWAVASPSKAVRRLGAVAGASIVAMTVLAEVQPVVAQEPGCIDGMALIFEDGTVEDLHHTTREAPATLPLEDGRQFVFTAEAPGIERGVLRVFVDDDANPLLNLVTDRLLVWHGDIVGGTVEIHDRILDRTGPGGYLLESTGLHVPPWGRFRTQVTVTDLEAPSGTVCTETVWIQFAATPFTSPVGVLGGGLVVLSLAGFAATDLLRRRMGPSPQPVASSARPIRRVGPDPGKVDVHFEQVVSGPGATTNTVPVDPGEPLVQGRTYRLVVDITPDLDVDEVDDRQMAAATTSTGLRIKPSLSVSMLGAHISIPLDFTPERAGRHSLAVDVLSNGHLLRTEHVEASVIEADETTTVTAEHATRAVLAPSDFTSADLASRRPREVTIVLESDTIDGSINSRVYSGADLVCHVDATNAAASVVDEAFRSRERLGGALRTWAEREGAPDRTVAVGELRALAVAGRYLHRALFPPGEVTTGSVEDMTHLVRSGATVQVNHARSGLGRATLPWALVYDRPLADLGPDNHICDAFPDHPVDDCPHVDDPTVFCPSGFWGYRAIIEQPEAEVQDVMVPPPVFADTSGSVVAHLLADLSDSRRARTELATLGSVRWVDDLRDLIAALSAADPLAAVYLYTHDARRDDRPALVVGSGRLTPLTFDGLGLDWPTGPLVFLNACSTGAALPEDALTFIRVFRMAGASCVVTTECEVFDPYAGTVGTDLIRDMFAGRPLGPGMLDLRRRLLDRLNPLGLAYGIHGPTDRTIIIPPGTPSPDTP